MSWEEDDLARLVKVLAGTTAIPFKVAAGIASDVAESLESYVPKPSKFASTLIDMRINTLKTITNVIEKEITLLERYKKDLEAKEEETKEKTRVQ